MHYSLVLTAFFTTSPKIAHQARCDLPIIFRMRIVKCAEGIPIFPYNAQNVKSCISSIIMVDNANHFNTHY